MVVGRESDGESSDGLSGDMENARFYAVCLAALASP